MLLLSFRAFFCRCVVRFTYHAQSDPVETMVTMQYNCSNYCRKSADWATKSVYQFSMSTSGISSQSASYQANHWFRAYSNRSDADFLAATI